jgi:polyribonucleotide nucleotidyltransferase
MIDALLFAHRECQPIIDLQEKIRAAAGKPRREFAAPRKDEELEARVRGMTYDKVRAAMAIAVKQERYGAMSAAHDELLKELCGDGAPYHGREKEVDAAYEGVKKKYARAKTLETGSRIDGRRTTDIRNITCEVSVLPRTHGSALFTRGQTQALVAVTLGTAADAQRLDSIDAAAETTRTFMLHYNFPPFSTGEVRPVRGTSRREIGHGNLAERALQAVLPDFADFPYTLRIVSEILESNGSSSMATVCGGSLAMMDAGIPIRGAVAGVAMGLIKEGKKYAILTDILGTEDHLGDMDFKVAGTRNGITSIQMDIKIEGLDLQIMKEALAQAKDGRLHILGEMDKALAEPRAELSPYAPRIVTLQINPEKIGDLIGPKGKTIRGIQDETGAELTVDDSGLVTIAAVGGDAMQRARQMVQAITAEPEIGATYEGTVKTTTAFGAFVEIMPGTEGLVHISELKHGRTEKTEDVVNKGDRVTVKLLDRDERGRLRLSMKALVERPEGMPEEEPRPPRGEGDGDRPRSENGGDRPRRGGGRGGERSRR